jgi:two-component system LytT family response regulator
MKKVLIIDDEPLARSLVKEYLEDHAQFEVAGECDNGFEGVKAIAKAKPDLIFLDVQMPRISGFEMLELLEQPPPVIFTTAFDEYALRAFEQNAIDYLLKPFSKERFDEAIQKWQQRVPGNTGYQALQNFAGKDMLIADHSRIVVRNNSEISIIPVGDITYLEAFDDYVKIFTKDTYYLKKKTMSFYEETLDPQKFFRIHRSFIINLSELTRIEPMEKNSYVALLKNGKKVPISRSSYSKLREKLGI